MAVNGKVLVLGSGLCAPPLIEYFSKHGYHVTVASRTLARANSVCKGLANVTTTQFDIESEDAAVQLEVLVPQHDVVISMLPYVFHVQAAKVAIKHKKHFCTTSYVSDAMAALDDEAKAAGVMLLNECGVDPGLDHMSAKRVIDEVHKKGGKIKGFYSVCGGLPAPQNNNNPLGYKLSWSPRGVLLASRNNAEFRRQGKDVSIPGSILFTEQSYQHDVVNGTDYEWYPNRDSKPYLKHYNIPECETICRGTYRNKGWCKFMTAIAGNGLISMDAFDPPLAGCSYAEFSSRVFGGEAKEARQAAAAKIGVPVDDDSVMAKLDWLGLFAVDVKVPDKATCALDAMCFLFESKMQYAPGEKDMLIMKHTFEVEYSSSHRETITSTLVDYGQQPKGHSSMARTVSLPIAVAARAVLDGRCQLRGLQRPVAPELYNLILDEMAELGVAFKEEKLAPHFWLRHEVKPGEERVLLSPAHCAKLLASGARVSVEHSPTRCIPDSEYAKAGCTMVKTASWTQAPYPTIISGLKELPEGDDALPHRHIFFAHCFKNQGGWKEILARFDKGGGMVWDLEFLVDDNGRRVAAFGRAAGLVGMAVGLLQWAAQQQGKPLGALSSWSSTEKLVAEVKAEIGKALAVSGRTNPPSALVIGALGRCGGGACWFAEQVGVAPVKWDLAETKGGGPFPALLKQDILINCIYLTSKIPHFLTNEMVDLPGRALSVFVDVSCDTSNPNNPFPIYNEGTVLSKPSLRVREGKGDTLPLDVVAIDHLPSLVPNDSSLEFSDAILPHILALKDDTTQPVWAGAAKIFADKVAAAKAK